MYRVEKFAPNRCPSCWKKFEREGRDYYLVTNDTDRAGKKVTRETDGYDRILCDKCRTITARFMLTAHLFVHKSDAMAMKKQGFINLQKVELIEPPTKPLRKLRNTTTRYAEYLGGIVTYSKKD